MKFLVEYSVWENGSVVNKTMRMKTPIKDVKDHVLWWMVEKSLERKFGEHKATLVKITRIPE